MGYTVIFYNRANNQMLFCESFCDYYRAYSYAIKHYRIDRYYEIVEG